jgi:hypothetical protein
VLKGIDMSSETVTELNEEQWDRLVGMANHLQRMNKFSRKVKIKRLRAFAANHLHIERIDRSVLEGLFPQEEAVRLEVHRGASSKLGFRRLNPARAMRAVA